MRWNIQNIQRVYGGVLALAGWTALVLQLVLLLSGAARDGRSLSGILIQYFSFFTILTNLLVAFSLTVSTARPASRTGKFFLRPGVMAALTLYILMVGIIYNLILKSLWNPQGLQLVADILLHQAVPAGYGAYWLFFCRKGTLDWKQPLRWLVYPLSYLVYVLIRGHLGGEYPYPFLDIGLIGYEQALKNILAVTVSFVFLAEFLVLADGLLKQFAGKGMKSR